MDKNKNKNNIEQKIEKVTCRLSNINSEVTKEIMRGISVRLVMINATWV